MTTRTRAILATGLLAPALAGCGGDPTLDAGSAEDFVRARVEAAGARVESVECPGGIRALTGVSFECLVTGSDGEQIIVTIRQTDNDGNLEPLDVTPVQSLGDATGGGGEQGAGSDANGDGIVDPDVAAAVARADAERIGEVKSIRCQEDVAVAAGGTVRCTADLVNGDRVVTDLEQTDELGTLRVAKSRQIAAEVVESRQQGR